MRNVEPAFVIPLVGSTAGSQKKDKQDCWNGSSCRHEPGGQLREKLQVLRPADVLFLAWLTAARQAWMFRENGSHGTHGGMACLQSVAEPVNIGAQCCLS